MECEPSPRSFKVKLKEALSLAIHEEKQLLMYVPLVDEESIKEVLNILEDMLYYFDIPGEFTTQGKKKHLFATQVSPLVPCEKSLNPF